jgi:Superfamily II DNA and RNA helicases
MRHEALDWSKRASSLWVGSQRESGDMENEKQSGAPVPAQSDYVSEASFDEMNLSDALRRAIAEHGYTRPTPVQTRTFRPVRDGRDVIVRSKTAPARRPPSPSQYWSGSPMGGACPRSW